MRNCAGYLFLWARASVAGREVLAEVPPVSAPDTALCRGLDRPGQKLARLRARPQGLSRRSLGALTIASPVCSMRWRSHAATAATPGCSGPSPGSNSSFSTTGDLPMQRLNRDAICWKFSTTATGAAQPSSPSQVDVKHWHDMIANPTVADAILDRLVHNAHRLNLAGESLRKSATKRPALDARASA